MIMGDLPLCIRSDLSSGYLFAVNTPNSESPFIYLCGCALLKATDDMRNWLKMF